MELLQAIILGIVQGFSEFLPISSSAHLILVPAIFDWQHHGIAFDVALHAGTAVAILLYFRKTWVELTKAFFDSLRERKINSQLDRRLTWFIILGTIPGGVAGWLGKSVIEENLREPWIIAVTSIFFGAFLYLADVFGRKDRDLEQIRAGDSLLIGLLQAVALIPGVSRSGITITTGLFQNFNRRAAAEFSFLLSAPIVVGAALKEGLHFFHSPDLSSQELLYFVVGVVTSAIAGFFCIRFFLRYVQTRSMLPFVIYRVALGILLLGYLRFLPT
ncbi:MAG: undecaprenyl-diphosphate phosphatase [Acidobacteria bacterium]|nr:undecaprenyl-diphosphate phosphatase [Acidobacteriota bacterium]MBI3658124.1 undecaprenyl-diphosphate phosphatase [Acidobacteriota bacterium]